MQWVHLGKKSKSRLKIILFSLCSLAFLNACAKENDQTTLMLLSIIYLVRNSPTVSCYYVTTSGVQTCLQNPSNADGLGSLCQFTPLLQGVRTVTNSSESCENMGYTNCSTQQNGSNSYQRCTK